MSLITNHSHQFFGVLEENSSFELDYEEGKVDALFFKYIGKLSKEDQSYNLFATKKNLSFTKILKEFHEFKSLKHLLSPTEIIDYEKIKSLKEDEFEELHQKKIKILKESFPAVEPSDLELTRSFFPKESFLSYTPNEDPSSPRIPKIMKKLGYGAELTAQEARLLIAIPSPETIQNQMQTIFDESDVDYSVEILHSPLIFSDQDFINAYLTHDVIITTGKEELHDHFLHVILVASIMLENPRGYIFEKRRIQHLLAHRIEKIKKDIEEKNIAKEDQEVLWLGLSATVDLILNFRSLSALQSVNAQYLIENSWTVFSDFLSYLPYLEKRFPGKIITPDDTQLSAMKRAEHLYQKIIQDYGLSGYR